MDTLYLCWKLVVKIRAYCHCTCPLVVSSLHCLRSIPGQLTKLRHKSMLEKDLSTEWVKLFAIVHSLYTYIKMHVTLNSIKSCCIPVPYIHPSHKPTKLKEVFCQVLSESAIVIHLHPIFVIGNRYTAWPSTWRGQHHQLHDVCQR